MGRSRLLREHPARTLDSISWVFGPMHRNGVRTQDAVPSKRCLCAETGKGTRVTLRGRTVTQNGETTSSTFGDYSRRASGSWSALNRAAHQRPGNDSRWR